VVIKFLLKL